MGRLSPCLLALLMAGGFLLTPFAAAQDSPSTAPVGWDRFVAPVLNEVGVVGLACFPSEYDAGRGVEILDPTGFEVHYTPADDPGEETVHSAGEPFVPPSGRWRVWLQGAWSMTPYSLLKIHPPRSRWRGLLTCELPVAPAGKVELAEGALDELGVDSVPDLWLLSAAGDRRGGTGELSRRRPVTGLGDGVLMPAGTTLAGLWNRRLERWEALSRPFSVEPRRTQPAPLGRPAAGAAWLKVYVHGPGPPPPDRFAGLELTAEQEGRRSRPDFTVGALQGMHAVWYGLRPGPVVLAGGDDHLYLDPVNLELADGGIADYQGPLVERPSLEVSLVLPELLRRHPLSLAVRELPGGDELAAVELSRDAGRHRFDGLVKKVVEVVLETHVGPFRRQVDLTAEDEAFLLLEPEVIEVFGTVRHGGEPHSATLEFQTVTGDAAVAEADEDGAYRALALHPLQWLSVDLWSDDDGEQTVPREPWMDSFMPPIRHSRELDVDIPDVDVTVRVVDATTREGIAAAQVGVRNEYLPPPEDEGEDEDRNGRDRTRMMGSGHQADETGTVRLPPPRPGRLEISAGAEGYRPMEQPLVLEIADPPQDRDLEIVLQPFGEMVELRLTLPDGTPAAGAEVLRVGRRSLRDVFFSDRADAAGVVEVPAAPEAGLLLLRHPGAASGIVEWAPWAVEERVEWVFAAAAGRPLTVRAMAPSGEDPAPGAAVAIWLDGHRLSGSILHWLLDARPRTDGNGFWTASNLPRGPVRVLAWSRQVADQAAAGALDTLAVTVSYPWPDTVDVEAVR